MLRYGFLAWEGEKAGGDDETAAAVGISLPGDYPFSLTTGVGRMLGGAPIGAPLALLGESFFFVFVYVCCVSFCGSGLVIDVRQRE